MLFLCLCVLKQQKDLFSLTLQIGLIDQIWFVYCRTLSHLPIQSMNTNTFTIIKMFTTRDINTFLSLSLVIEIRRKRNVRLTFVENNLDLIERNSLIFTLDNRCSNGMFFNIITFCLQLHELKVVSLFILKKIRIERKINKYINIILVLWKRW